MFDHGADSINAVLLAITISSIIQLGTTWCATLFMLCLTSGFYFATLEEYYCGRLDLPIINAVSDGCVFIYAVGLVSAFFGCNIWKAQGMFGFSVAQLGVGFLIMTALPTLVSK